MDTAHGQVASEIKGLEADYLSHKLAHALAGCVAGAAAQGTCKDGAIGAAVGEVVAGMFDGQRPSDTATASEINAYTQKVLAYSKLVAGATAAYAGGNAQTAVTAAETAVKNNGLWEYYFPKNLPKKNYAVKNITTGESTTIATIDTERQRITLIQPTERDLYAAGTGSPQVDGYTVIYGHASIDAIQGADPKNPSEWSAFINMIKTSGAWKPGQPIILHACNAGYYKNGVASALAKSLNVEIIAATTITWNFPPYSEAFFSGVYEKDKLDPKSPDFNKPGYWRRFSSNGNLILETLKKPF